MRRFMAFHWPGNVRQLENTVERAVAVSAGRAQIGSGASPQSSREIGVSIGHAQPGLVTAGAGAEDQERHRPQPGRAALVQVVELD